MEVVPGCGANFVLFFLLLVGCVLAETREYGSSDPTLARPGNSCGDRALSKVQSGIAPVLNEVDDADWTGPRKIGVMLHLKVYNCLWCWHLHNMSHPSGRHPSENQPGDVLT